MNMLADNRAGKHVDAKDLRKHRTDVARLLLAEMWNEPIVVPESVYAKITAFADEVRADSLQSIADALHVSLPVADELILGMTRIFRVV